MTRFIVPIGVFLVCVAACEPITAITPDSCATGQVYVESMCLECGPDDGCLETGPACRPACDDTAAFDCQDGAQVNVCG